MHFIEEPVLSSFILCDKGQSWETKIHTIQINRENNQQSQGSQYTANITCTTRWFSFFRADTSDRGKIKLTQEICCLYK